MAIKGKRRGKAHSARAVPRGPRPVYVTPKVPLLRRTGTKVLLVALIEALVFAVLLGFDAQEDTERQRDVVREYGALVDSALFTGGAAQQLPTGAVPLPQLTSALSQLTSGEAGEQDVQGISGQIEEWATTARDAADRISGLEIRVEDLEPRQRLALSDARNLMARGLLAYAGVAEQVGIALELEGDQRERLLGSIMEQLNTVAGPMFSAGYARLLEERRRLGLPVVADTGQVPGGLPGGLPGGGLPGGLPGGGLPGGGLPPDILPEGDPGEPAGEGGGGGQGGGGGGGQGGGGGGGDG